MTAGIGERLEGHFDGLRALELVRAQCELGPRVAGSVGNVRCRKLISERLAGSGWPVVMDPFTFRRVSCCNLVARVLSEEPAIMLGAHFDTRPRADRERQWWRRRRPVPGANDGASGVAVLIELARVLAPPPPGLWLAFFDAEDRGRLEGWPFCVGSGHLAESLHPAPAAVVVVDMVGGTGARFLLERTSHEGLSRAIWQTAAALGFGGTFGHEPGHAVLDDHTPFLRRGIAAADIVDLDYLHWHRVTDTPENVAAETLRRVGLVLETLVRTGGWRTAVR
ncbi:MAG TPA: M28 family peptidase [Thermoanaerobaculaceae bacterium]|nr:M28 family peptidase [Thermoanaerobaculaceae bacterium]HPS80071.1 M28 family peptidase [Thermoanaerobaculaceae bacterium]